MFNAMAVIIAAAILIGFAVAGVCLWSLRN
jgi:hypothetical protein